MPGKAPAVFEPASGQADSGRNKAGSLAVPTPENPLWYPQVARTGHQGVTGSLPKFGLASTASQPPGQDAGLYSTDTLPSLEQYELPLLKAQKVHNTLTPAACLTVQLSEASRATVLIMFGLGPITFSDKVVKHLADTF